ncbi:MAG: lysylphosphatidylglycerol synthase transmembrane domain-containing protein, partial [Candidatus Magasanikbacteria bacterium]
IINLSYYTNYKIKLTIKAGCNLAIKMRKNKAKISIIILLVLAVASFFVLLKSIGPEKIVKTLLEIDIWKLALVVLAYIINLGFFAWRWKRVLKTQDLDINYFSLTEYRFAGFSISYLTPASNFGGEPVMAYLLKEKEEADFPQALSSIIINRLIELLSKVSFITISILYAFFFLILPNKITILFYIFAALVVLLLLPAYFFILKTKNLFTA